jgi:Ni/Fe-hydrogenase 1 B-type cytochrome subunit
MTYVVDEKCVKCKTTDYVAVCPVNCFYESMVALLVLLLFLQAVTGRVLAGTDIYFPPFGRWITTWIAAPGADPSTIVPYNKTGIDAGAYDAMRSFRAPFVKVHYWVFFGLLLSVAVHIIGVVVTELREGGGIVSAMITGTKVFAQKPGDAAPKS